MEILVFMPRQPGLKLSQIMLIVWGKFSHRAVTELHAVQTIKYTQMFQSMILIINHGFFLSLL